MEFIPTTTQALRAVSDNPGGIYYASAPEVIGQCKVKPLSLGRTPDQLVALHQLPLVHDLASFTKKQGFGARSARPKPLFFIVNLRTLPSRVTRRLLVIIKENGQIDQQAGEAYAAMILSQQGQQFWGRSDFVRIQ